MSKKKLGLTIALSLAAVLVSACGSTDAEKDGKVETKEIKANENQASTQTKENESSKIEEEKATFDTTVETKKEEKSKVEKVLKPAQKEITIAQIDKALQTALAAKDEVKQVKVEKNRVMIHLILAEDPDLGPKSLAETTYERIAEQLLVMPGWQVLEVQFDQVGSVSIDRKLAEESEFGFSFPNEEIQKQLGGIE